MEDLIHHSVSENLLVDLAVKEDARPQRLALVQEVQHHPLTGEVLHVDFHEVSPTEKVTLMVPVASVGEAVGVIGRNGAGKSTLCRIITGHESADSGTITRNTALRLSYLEQHDTFKPGERVRILSGDGTSRVTH